MRPWEFDRLTLTELRTMADWAEWREDRQWQLAAWMCAKLMNATGNMKQPVSADTLLGSTFEARQEARQRRMMKVDED